MACSKYTLTNTGTTVINFNYRRCDDAMWQYQVELYPNQTKNIWLMDNTYSIAPLYVGEVVLINEGVFPPVYPTPTATPTPTVTPSNTASQTPTPSVTASQTQTPTVTPTQTGTPDVTPSPTATVGATPTATETQTPTPTQTNTGTPDVTPTSTTTPTTTITASPTETETPTPTPTNTGTPDVTPTPTNTGTPDVTPTPSTTIGATPTSTETQTPTPTETPTETPTNTPTQTQTGTPDVTTTPTNTETPTPTETPTNTPTQTQTGTPDVTTTPTPTNTETPTQTPTYTPTPSITPTPAFRVLYIGGPNAVDEAQSIQEYLTLTGYSSSFSAVSLDTTTIYTGSGNITPENYDAVVFYTIGNGTGSTYSADISTALYDYVSSGGSFVTGARLWSAYPVGFNHSELTAFNVRNTFGNVIAGGTVWQNQVLSNPITSGLPNSGFGTSISINGSNTTSPTTPLLTSTNAKQLAQWSSPTYAMSAYKKVSGATLVSLNAYVPSITTFTSTTMNELYGNSILFSLGYLPEPITYVEVTNADDTNSAIITGVTISGVTDGSLPLGGPVSGDTFPLSYPEFNTGFTTTQWGASPYVVTVGINVLSLPPSPKNIYLYMGDAYGSYQTILSANTSGDYTFPSQAFIGNMVTFPSGQLYVGVGNY